MDSRGHTNMRSVCQLAAVLWWATTCTTITSGRAVAVEFEQRQPSPRYGGDYSNYYYGGHDAPAEPVVEQESPRTHHVKHKFKKLKKRLLLQCLLGHGRRRRRDSSDEASGRFILPVVLQSTNVNVGSGGGYGGQQQHQQQSHHNGCMQMFGGDSHGPLQQGSLPSLGSLGSTLGSLNPFGPQVTENPEEDEGGNRNGLSYYAADWNRYARQFRRNFVRPLYRLF